MKFQLAAFTFTLQAQTGIKLPPYKGSALRGGFGHAFRRVACVARDKDCAVCLLKHKCVYASVFESPIPEGSQVMRKYRAAPHPFVICPADDDKQDYAPWETLRFDLTLIGNTADYLPYFIYAFEELGRMGLGKGRGRFDLLEVTSSGVCTREREDHQPLRIYDGKEKVLTSGFSLLSWEDALAAADSLDGTGITLHFLTPTRIIHRGRLALKPEFHAIFRTLLRRLSLLSYFYCGGDPEETDFRALIDRAGRINTAWDDYRWRDWERYSARQDTRMKLGGFVGIATFTGNLKPFLPHLIIGQRIHIGKNTTFGLGKYKILLQQGG